MINRTCDVLSLILTMDLLGSKGEDKLHFSVFWKPVVCTGEKGLQSGSMSVQRTRGTARSPTFERLIELLFPEDDPQVVNSAGVELHPEYHVPTRAAVTLVVALELEGEEEET